MNLIQPNSEECRKFKDGDIIVRGALNTPYLIHYSASIDKYRAIALTGTGGYGVGRYNTTNAPYDSIDVLIADMQPISCYYSQDEWDLALVKKNK